MLVVFFLAGEGITWINCLTGFGWRAWLLLYALPSWFTVVKAPAVPDGAGDVTTNRKSPFVSMAAPLPILVSDPNGCLTLSKARAHCAIRSTSKNTWNEIVRYLRCWL